MRATMVRMLLITTMMLIFELRIVKLSAMELFFEGDSNLQPIWDSDGVGISELQGEPVNLQKEEALEELKETLGIRGNFKKDSYKDTPPQFMTELYNTITDSTGKTRMKNPFNAAIVRSFIGRDSSSVGYFIFNVSGLDQNEFVLEAELHLYRQRSSPKSMPLSVLSSPYYLVKVYQVLQDKSLGVPDLHRLLNVHYVGAYASGWQVFNVKQAVLSWLSGIPNLGLLVSATTIFGDPVSINFSSRHDLPHEKQPILVLFNDDNVQVYPKQIVNHEKEDKVDNKQRAIADLEDEEIVFMNSIIESDKEREKRNARATKGQPEEALEVITGNRPKKFRREKKPQAQADVNRSQKMHEFVSRRKSLENTLTSLDIYQRAMLREKLNLRKQDIIRPEILHNSLKVKREAASASSVTIAAPTDECSKPQLEPCAKHELYVNFRDIGLSTIIAPEGYAAYQCRGHCESPLSQEQKPTNHATIQGIIHKMNLASSEDVQTPCCVPVNLSSISILYHDEERDGVVLKSYADMAVVSCGCR